MRSTFVGYGILLLIMWLACNAITFAPGPWAYTVQWAAGNALSFCAGIAFGAAAFVKHRTNT